jgi:hypothetical protein
MVQNGRQATLDPVEQRWSAFREEAHWRQNQRASRADLSDDEYAALQRLSRVMARLQGER